MKIDKQIKQWAQMVLNESEDYQIEESVTSSETPLGKTLDDEQFQTYLEEECSYLLLVYLTQECAYLSGEKLPIKFKPKYHDTKPTIYVESHSGSLSRMPDNIRLYDIDDISKKEAQNYYKGQNFSHLLRQLKNNVGLKNRMSVFLKPGKYQVIDFMGLDITLEVNENFIVGELKPLNAPHHELKKMRKSGLQYHKPNLPQESKEIDEKHESTIIEDEKDGTRYGTDPIQASVDTVTSDGIGQNEFHLEMSKLEQWLSDIGATESYDDIKEDILSGTETTIHLSQPISTVTLVMPKPKH